MLNILYNSFIYPLIQLLEQILGTAYSVTGNYGISILILSIAVNIVIFPFYALADSWQLEERSILKKMQKKREDIKAVFRGDEQYFYLKTLYRQNHYNPLMAIRSSFGLLIQIPFFIGAYQFLSHFQALENQSFLFLNNLARPDQLAGAVNVMPFIMTLVNITSAFVYSKDLTRRDRIQLFGMAALFLVLLYNSPSGLLLYWTCNNLISLIKNLAAQSGLSSKINSIPPIADRLYRFMRIPSWSIVLAGLFSIGAVGFFYLSKSKLASVLFQTAYPLLLVLAFISLIYFLSKYKNHFFNNLALLLILFLWPKVIGHLLKGPYNNDFKVLFFTLFYLCGISFIVPLIENLNRIIEKKEILSEVNHNRLFHLTITVLVLLGGIVLQTSLVSASPGEIIYSGTITVQAFCWSLMWLGIIPLFFYYAGPGSFRKPLIITFVIITFMAIVNFLFFPGDYGVISDSLQFESITAFEARMNNAFNLGIMGLLIILICFLFYIKKELWIRQAVILILIASFGISIINIVKIQTHESRQNSTAKIQDSDILESKIAFSREKQNTVILFLDRALAGAVLPALEAYPELKEDYDGFTWYKDALSFGVNTVTSLPAMLGGYEYTPQGMIERQNKTLEEKIAESWMILPEYFLKNDHSVYITYNNNYHMKFPADDLQALSEENMTIDSHYDVFTNRWFEESGYSEAFNNLLLKDKSIFMFSLFRMSPLFFRAAIYNNGSWNSIAAGKDAYDQVSNLATAMDLLKEWGALHYLPELSHTDSEKSTFSFISNKATHEVLGINSRFQPSVAKVVYPEEDLKKYGSVVATGHIYTNIAVLKKVSQWFDWMKKNNVYDNTQIIIAADHGRLKEKIYNPLFEGVKPSENYPDFNGFHPLFLFKPFKSRGTMKISDDFMTNADIPSMVLEAFGEYENPYTGNPISAEKKSEPLLVGNGPWEIFKHLPEQYQYIESYYVKDSMLDPSNWSKVK